MEVKAFIIHAEKFEERKLHMDRMLSSHTLPFEYVQKGSGDQASNEEKEK